MLDGMKNVKTPKKGVANRTFQGRREGGGWRLEGWSKFCFWYFASS